MNRRASHLLSAALALSLCHPCSAAAPLPIGDPALRDSRASTAEPNISGVWQVRGAGLRIAPMEGGDPPWKPWAEKVFRDRAADEKRGVTQWDPTGACYGSGTPRILTVGYMTEIIQTADVIVWTFESQHVYRVIQMNRKMPANPGHSIRGYSVGHWEGDTLVVETRNMTATNAITPYPRSAEARVIERWQRRNDPQYGDSLHVDVTVIDPQVFAEPGRGEGLLKRAPKGVHVGGYNCSEQLWDNYVAAREKGLAQSGPANVTAPK